MGSARCYWSDQEITDTRRDEKVQYREYAADRVLGRVSARGAGGRLRGRYEIEVLLTDV